MRKIKYRGKDVKTEKFIYGLLVKNLRDKFCIQEEKYECHCITVKEVIPETVGQYTEQNDFNGDEIYEKMTVHQKTVLAGAPEIDYCGEVKFYDGSWWIDNDKDAVLLFNECCENIIIKD